MFFLIFHVPTVRISPIAFDGCLNSLIDYATSDYFFSVLVVFCNDDVTNGIGIGIMNNEKTEEKILEGLLLVNYLSKDSII